MFDWLARLHALIFIACPPPVILPYISMMERKHLLLINISLLVRIPRGCVLIVVQTWALGRIIEAALLEDFPRSGGRIWSYRRHLGHTGAVCNSTKAESFPRHIRSDDKGCKGRMLDHNFFVSLLCDFEELSGRDRELIADAEEGIAPAW